ncbi:SymE family type I addiction module toxin [Yersinia massiliensis]|uniref:SymE family type I addiction module toxin n=1 Tax=Yersinia massiliensis TaxID=419257 RepID=UPI003B435B74
MFIVDSEDVGFVTVQRQWFQAISLRGKWLTEVGFTEGMLLKIRIMPGCMVLTAQTPASCGAVWKDSALNRLTM